MQKYVERAFCLYQHFGVNNVFTIDEAVECIKKEQNKDIGKETLRSSIDIAHRKGLISCDSKLAFPYYYNYHHQLTHRDKKESEFVNREEMKHYDKMKTYYRFDEKNLMIMIKKFSLKPREEDITPEVVKIFLDPERS